MTDKKTIHQDLHARGNGTVGTEKSFGLVFAVIFLIIALSPLFTLSGQYGTVRIWALIIATLFMFSALTIPRLLAPLNKLWLMFGSLLYKTVNPLVMGLIFFMIVMPIGLVMRLLGKTTLRLNFDKTASSYWVYRTKSGPTRENMKRQL